MQEFQDLINANMMLSTKRTGNFFIDTIVLSSIMYMITFFGKLILNYISSLKHRGFFFFGSSIELKGSKYISTKWIDCRVEASKAFLAVIHRIKCVDGEVAGVKRLMELSLERFSTSTNSIDLIENTKIDYILDQYKPIRLKENIFCKVINDQDESVDKKSAVNMKSFYFTIKIYSKIYGVNVLKEFVDECITEYNNYLINNSINKKYFSYSYYDTDSYKSIYTSSIFAPNMRFDTLFFPGKQKLYNRLKFFIDNEKLYLEQGVPYTLGLLFHGKPGCGKTSSIKAIANMTNRHVINVPLGQIKTATELESIFTNPEIDSKSYIPNNRRIYVLEDIDCREVDDIVKERSSKFDKNKDKDKDKGKGNENMSDKILMRLMEQNDETDFSNYYNKNKQKKLNMANLLEILDGIYEMHGRILIITTNYRDKLDRALTRPGRIDMEIEFKRCTVDVIDEMYYKFYNESLKDGERADIVNEVWSPAEIRKILFENNNNPKRALEIIKSRVTFDTSDGEMIT